MSGELALTRDRDILARERVLVSSEHLDCCRDWRILESLLWTMEM